MLTDGISVRDNKSKLLLFAACAMLLAPFFAEAAGLGRLTLYSALGQPLNAEIELLSVQKGETVTARLASPEVYSQAGAQYNNALAGTRVTVEKRPNGQLYLKATSPRPISEPFLELLIEINSEHGRVVRQYTALLDPPGYGRAAGEIPPPSVASAPETRAPVAAPSPAPSAAPPAETPTAPPPAVTRRAPRASTAADVPPPQTALPRESGARQYGPVKRGETLGRIARNVKPEGVTLEQTLVGLYRHNPDAFIRQNMNLVRSGRILSVPEAKELAELPHAQAVQQVRLQTADFNAYRTRAGERVATASETATVTSGKIAAPVVHGGGSEGPRDTVRLSRGETKGKGNEADRLRALEEEAVARDKALAEANARIAQLEKLIAESQRAADSKGGAAAKGTEKAAQAPASTAVVPVPAPPGKAPEAASTKSDKSEPPVADKSAATTTAQAPQAAAPRPSAPAPKAEGAPQKSPEPVRQPEGNALDTLLSEPLYLAAGGAVVVLGTLGILMARRRRAAERDVDVRERPKVAPSLKPASTADTSSSPAVAAPASPDATSPPPRVAPRPEPSPAVTAAAAAAAGSAAARQVPSPTPPRSASEADDNDLDFHVGAPSVSTSPTARMAAAEPSLRDRAPLDGAEPAAAASPTRDRAPERFSSRDASATSEPIARAAAPSVSPAPPEFEPLPPNPEIGTEPARAPDKPTSRAAEVLRAAQAQRATDSDTAHPPGPDFALDTGSAEAKPLQEPPALSKDPHVLDFDLEPLPPVGSGLDMDKVSSEPPASVDFKLDLADLDIGASGQRASAPVKDDHWYDVQQKFDLAKAYEEMGDKSGARDILQEVLREGDSEQQEQAKKLLGSLA